MKALELEMPDEIYRKLERMAANDHQQIDAFARRKLEELVTAVDSFGELERRAQRADRSKFEAAMTKVSAATPMVGDELPR